MPRRVVVLALAVLAGGLVGCVGTEDPDGPGSPPGARNGTPETDPSAVAIADCEFSCFEPNLAIGPNATVYVAEAVGELARSTDGGETFTSLGQVPLPPGSGENDVQSDGLVDVADSGALYYSALILNPSGPGAAATIEGIQVAASHDGGESWPRNTYVALEDGGGEPVQEVDGQWLAFGEEATVYLSYAQRAGAAVGCAGSGLWVARSDDGGETFSSFTRAAGYEQRRQCGQAGPPTLAGENLLLPYWANRPDPLAGGVERGIDLAVSEDRGESFRQTEALSTEGGWFPVLADTDQGLSLVFHGMDGRVMTTSAPGGSWLEPKTWSQDGNRSVTSPWIAAGPEGSVAIGWATGADDGAVLHVQQAQTTGEGLRPTGPPVDVARLETNSSNSANTDFVDLAFFPNGEAATVWAPGDGTVRFARLPG